MTYSALIDASTQALLALSAAHIVALLAKSQSLEAETAYDVNLPNYRKGFPLERAASHTYPSWTWDGEARLFNPTAPPLISAELKERSQLAIAKCGALAEITHSLSIARCPSHRGVLMQETVYLNKKMQAERFKAAGYPEDEMLAYPYVLQYAEISGLDPRAAADEILFKAQLDDESLVKTEGLRLKYFGLVDRARKASELDRILKAFRRETYGKRSF